MQITPDLSLTKPPLFFDASFGDFEPVFRKGGSVERGFGCLTRVSEGAENKERPYYRNPDLTHVAIIVQKAHLVVSSWARRLRRW